MAKARIPEKVEQQHIVQLLRSVGGHVYVLGTKRGRGEADHGTHQTPGIPDVFAFVPDRAGSRPHHTVVPMFALFVEVKAVGGRLRPEQADFKNQCVGSPVHHLVGGYDVVVAWLIQNGLVRRENVPHYRLPAELRP